MQCWCLKAEFEYNSAEVSSADEEKCSAHFLLTYKKELVGSWMDKGSLGFSIHEMVEFKIRWAEKTIKSKLRTTGMRSGDFDFFKDLL